MRLVRVFLSGMLLVLLAALFSGCGGGAANITGGGSVKPLASITITVHSQSNVVIIPEYKLRVGLCFQDGQDVGENYPSEHISSLVSSADLKTGTVTIPLNKPAHILDTGYAPFTVGLFKDNGNNLWAWSETLAWCENRILMWSPSNGQYPGWTIWDKTQHYLGPADGANLDVYFSFL